MPVTGWGGGLPSPPPCHSSLKCTFYSCSDMCVPWQHFNTEKHNSRFTLKHSECLLYWTHISPQGYQINIDIHTWVYNYMGVYCKLYYFTNPWGSCINVPLVTAVNITKHQAPAPRIWPPSCRQCQGQACFVASCCCCCTRCSAPWLTQPQQQPSYQNTSPRTGRQTLHTHTLDGSAGHSLPRSRHTNTTLTGVLEEQPRRLITLLHHHHPSSSSPQNSTSDVDFITK